MGKPRLLRGFARIRLTNPDGSIAHEDGFENTFTEAFRADVLNAIGAGTAPASKPAYIAIGTGGQPVSNTNALPGELSDTRIAVSAGSAVSASSRLRYTGSFAATANTGDVSNMGIYTTNSGSNLLCGNTFSGGSFAKASNQELSVTYDITF